MPYSIRQYGSQYCVVKDDDEKKMGCHDTKEKARKQLAAIQISEKKQNATVEEWEEAMVSLQEIGEPPVASG